MSFSCLINDFMVYLLTKDPVRLALLLRFYGVSNYLGKSIDLPHTMYGNYRASSQTCPNILYKVG